jgi:hypothetical protein
VVHALGIESHGTNPGVKAARGLRTLESDPVPAPRCGGHETPCQRDHAVRPNQRQIHKQFSVLSSRFSETQDHPIPS